MVRVFINHVDSFTGQALSKVFGSSVVGATLDDSQLDEADAEGEASAHAPGGAAANLYQVVGTLRDPSATKPPWISEVIQTSSSDDLLTALTSCDVIVYHIVEDIGQVEEASWAAQALHDNMASFSSPKTFISVSTVLTWARSKPLDPDDPDVAFTEEDYRRRRQHPNFKDHIAAEKLFIKLGKTDKSKLQMYVIASGLTYGIGEGIFHFLFKMAWLGEVPALPLFGTGQNVVPTVHINDLASMVVNVADSKPKTHYILGLDDSQSTLEEIVRAISRNLGTGKINKIPKEDALLSRDLTQYDYDHLLVNLKMEATCAKDSMHINWVSENGLVENILAVIKEYKKERGLLPIRVCVLGPPAAGKTHVVQQLCHHYKLHHIKIADVVKEAIEQLERTAARADVEDEEEEEDAGAEGAQEHLDLLKEDKEENKGRYSDQHILEFYKQKLLSKPSQNQGFILDGYPKTCEQAKELFAYEGGDEDEQEEDVTCNKLLMPEVVFSLDATDEFLKERVMNLPESVVTGTHNTEDGLLRRLALYRDQNEEDKTVFNYFDELEIHPEHIDVEKDQSQNMEASVEQMKKIIGEPRNYGLSPEEKAELDRKLREEELLREAHEREERERNEAEEREARAQREAEWNAQLEQVKREEKEMLETKSIPLRNYLMKHVMPTLTQGLIEICKVKPDDPVDYLAEYLFKKNPQID